MHKKYYNAQGQYEGATHSLGHLDDYLMNFGPSPPIVDPVSGRICLSVHAASKDALEKMTESFGVTDLVVPEGVTVDDSTSVLLITSPDTSVLLSVVVLPVFTLPTSCNFYTNHVDEPGRYVVCSGSRMISSGSRVYRIGHVAVMDTKQNTVQIQPVPGPSTNSVPSSTFDIHMLSHSPCKDMANATDNRASVHALLYGEEGTVQATTGSVLRGSSGVLQHVELTHLFKTASDSNTNTHTGLSEDGTTLVVPNITEWDSIAPDRILSRTIVAADNPTSHRNAVTELKSVVPELPNVFLISSLYHGWMTHTAWKDAHNRYQIQLVDICESVYVPVDPNGPSDPDSEDASRGRFSTTEWVLVSLGGVLVCGGILAIVIRKRKKQSSALDMTSQPFLDIQQ